MAGDGKPERAIEELKKLLITRREFRDGLRLLQGELGGFKAEIYNHLHALENRIDALVERSEGIERGCDELRGSLKEMRMEMDTLRRRMDAVESKLKHLDSSILFLIAVGVIAVILLATLLFRAFTMP